MAILKALFIFKWLMFLEGRGMASGGQQCCSWCQAPLEARLAFRRAPAQPLPPPRGRIGPAGGRASPRPRGPSVAGAARRVPAHVGVLASGALAPRDRALRPPGEQRARGATPRLARAPPALWFFGVNVPATLTHVPKHNIECVVFK